ncbi:MAG: hypothetical protein R2855_04765 [Thermomicrobiales bacterium]
MSRLLLLANSRETARAESLRTSNETGIPNSPLCCREHGVYAIELLERVFDLTDAAVIDGLAIPGTQVALPTARLHAPR